MEAVVFFHDFLTAVAKQEIMPFHGSATDEGEREVVRKLRLKGMHYLAVARLSPYQQITANAEHRLGLDEARLMRVVERLDVFGIIWVGKIHGLAAVMQL